MSPDRWQQIEELCRKARGWDVTLREAFLHEACAGDESLRQQVESLLAQESEVGSFLQANPLQDIAAQAAHEGKRFEQSPQSPQKASPEGTLLGSYLVRSKIGEGGMGEVYRAFDTKLRRDVALKVLPKPLAQDPERLTRFRREAQLLASLNHKNIGVIHGFEETPRANFLVLELVEGETFGERIRRQGPLPIKDALTLASQVAEGLEAAHRKGITHRDIKPANIKVTPDGEVKVLDFGLAKVFAGDRADPNLTELPTLEPGPTRDGQILGTPAYMSPEQVRGQEVDKRTDIWAFGCVLYALLTGKQAFRGDTVHDTISKVLNGEPDWQSLPPSVPEKIRDLLRRCFQKEKVRRLRDIGDARIEIDELLGAWEAPSRSEAGRLVPAWRLVLGAVGLLLVVGLLLTGLWYWRAESARQAAARQPSLADVSFLQLTNQPGEESYPSLSPDGRSVVYASRASGNWDIYFQRVGGQNPINLTQDSHEDETQPAFSPDGDFIAFRSEREDGGIFVMGATGESAKRLTDFGYHPAWSADGEEIVFASHGFDMPSARGMVSQLWIVTVATGDVRKVATNLGDAVQPSWSPLGTRIAFWSGRSTGDVVAQRDIWTVSVGGGEPTRVTNDPAMDWNPVWSPEGNYLYFSSDRGGSMNFWRARIEEESGKVLGELEPVTTGGGAATRQHLSISRGGQRMVFVERIAKSNLQRIAFDPARESAVGQPIWITQGSRQATTPDPSPDGEWVAFSSMGAPQEDLFVIGADGRSERRITDDPPRERFPRWSPDGKRIAFFSNRVNERWQIWTINPDGSGLQQLGETDESVIIPSWSPDGLRVAYYVGGEFENFISELDKPWKDHTERLPAFSESEVFGVNSWSPDGMWLAGHVLSRSSSTNDPNGTAIYSLGSKRFEKLTDFGWAPVWLSDSRRLLFPYRDKIYLVDSRSKEFREIFSVNPYTIFPYGLSVSKDDRMIYYTVEMNEADVWLMNLQ